MKEVLEFLEKNNVFFIATTEGNKPKVRPFGFVMEYEGNLCFCTNNQKPTFKQMQNNPYLEICSLDKDNNWLRLCGKAVLGMDKNAKIAALEKSPFLKNLYNENDDIFEVFYLDDVEATIENMQGEKRKIEI